MKILLLNPPFKKYFSRSSRSPAVSKGGTLYYPIWLSYCAGVLEQENFEVKLVDGVAEDLSFISISKIMRDFAPDLLVVDTSTPSIYNDIEMAARLKNCNRSTFVVLVGTHVSALPEWTLNQSPNIDAVAIKEYDYTIRKLAYNLLAKKEIYNQKGLALRLSGHREIVNNGPNDQIIDLDRLPNVAEVYKRHLNPRNYYFAAASFPMLQIITGRGCPFHCFFCVYPQTFHSRRYRLRSAESVVDEIEFIKNYLPEVREIGIEDDTFTANKERTRKICQLILTKNLKIKWYCNVRADLDFETMKIMKRAGCRMLTIGFESGNHEILKGMRKGITAQMSYLFMKNAKRARLLVHGCMMVGNPNENKKTMEESFRFAKKLDCDSFQFYPLFPYPGTEAYSWLRESGHLKTENFKDWLNSAGGHNCVFDLPGLTSDEMVFFCDQAYRRYHLNFRYLIKKGMQLLSNPNEGIRSLKSGINFFKN